MKFLDEAIVTVMSGAGGAGCVSFRREKFVEFGGPDGGNGGKGGDVVIEAVGNLNTLIDYRYQQLFKGKTGMHGSGANRTGAAGDDVVLKVPVGTEVVDADTGDVLVDMAKLGQKIVLLEGGRGGRGNMSFRTSTNQAPRQFTPGGEAKELKIMLRLKLFADMGLLGLPNAGKSTFVAKVSRAKPKIADYAFTTLKPALGMVRHHSQDFVVADLPGLIEGAADGVGLGHRFLKHLSRCAGVLHLVDVSAEAPWEAYKTVRAELEAYDDEYGSDLAGLPEVLCLSKVDMLGPDEVADVVKAFKKKAKVKHVALLSVHSGQGLDEVLAACAALVKERREQDADKIELDLTEWDE